MPQRVHRHKTTLPFADISSQGMKAKIPAYQFGMTNQQNSVYTISMTPSPSTDSFSNAKTLLFDLHPMEFGQLLDILLRFKISCSTADVQLCPAPYLIKEIIVYASPLANTELCRFYPETIVASNYLTKNTEERRRDQQECMYKEVYNKSNNTAKVRSNANYNTIVVGETRYISLPLPAGFFKTLAIDGRNLRNPIRVRIDLESDICVSGSVNNISLDDVQFVINSVNEDKYDLDARDTIQKFYKQKYIYLDVEKTSWNDKTLSPSVKSSFDLSSFQGISPFLLVCVRPSTQSASAQTKWKFYDVGDYAKFDIENSGGSSQLGNGTPIYAEDLYKNFAYETKNPCPYGYYFVPLCEMGTFRKAMAGAMCSGGFEFVGAKDNLCITFGDGGNAEVHTITKTNASASSGNFRMATSVAGASPNAIAYNATTTNIKDNINEIDEVGDRDYSMTVANLMNSATATTITFSVRDGSPCREIGTITPIGDGMYDAVSCSVSTRGRTGFISGTGTDYTTEIYFYKFKELCVDEFGNLDARDL